MGQVDFSRGSAVSPMVEVIVTSVAATYTPKSFGEEAIQRRTKKGEAFEVMSNGPTKLSGLDGHQFVVKQGPETAGGGGASFFVGRLTCMDQKDGTKLLYALVLKCHGGEAAQAEAILDKVAATFRITAPVAPSGKP